MNLRLTTRKPIAGKLSKQDEEVFNQAKELASLRLEQCLADRQISLPSVTDRPSTMQVLGKVNLL
jgi:hypothetical protein